MPDPAPPVSVVIPAYNREATIAAAIESVLHQTWRDFELIVVDDASSDATLAAAGRIADPRLRLVASPTNAGAAGARNRGVAEARGAWIAFQDSDDEWLPRKLEKQMARLAAAPPDTVAAYCGMLTLGGFDDDPEERLTMRYRPDPAVRPAEGDIRAPLLRANMISTQTLVVRRAVFLGLGGFDAESVLEDWDFALRLTQAGPVAFVDEPLVHQRFSPNSLTRDTARLLGSRIRLVERNREAFARSPAMLARQYQIIAGGCREHGDLAGARRWLALARRTHPASARLWALSLYVGLCGLGSRRAVRPST